MAAVAPSRLAALTRLRCEIFQTSYNPTSIRTGAKYLRARLRGPSMIQYYPEELTVARFNRMGGNFKVQDWAEYQRLADVEEKKRRGKGAPKKAKSPGTCASCSIATLNSCNFSFQRRVGGCPGSGRISGMRCAFSSALALHYRLHVSPRNAPSFSASSFNGACLVSGLVRTWTSA